MATYTEHYGLHQWEATDNFLRTDFNTDHQLIDTALGELAEEKAEIIAGSYMGDGAAARTIELGFQPKMVILVDETGILNSTAGVFGGIVTSAAAASPLKLTAQGFSVSGQTAKQNLANNTYHYAAFRCA